jgi:hypothetical protein
MAREQKDETSSAEKEELLSDLDARVLQSMLRDEKVDVRTEEGIRKLLERGTAKNASGATGVDSLAGDTAPDSSNDDLSSEFSSTVIKTLTNTKLWRKVSAQANDLLETVGIWVQNKIEQDVKVLAALGLFAWDRAVRDVARALPEAGQTSRRVLLLMNSSSYQQMEEGDKSMESVRRRMEDLNRPSEEIREVTRSILEILSGDRRAASDRRRILRTAAPAGTINSGERIRRAYKQRKLIERQGRDVTRIPGAVVDTAYELKQELKAEANLPGYRTAGIRNAIGAGVAETNRLLREVKEGARLAAAKKKALRLKDARSTAKSMRDDVVEGLRLERKAVAERLRMCIKEPENTWLREDVILSSEKQVNFDQDALREVVTAMMFVRDEIESQDDEEQPYEALMENLASIHRSLESIRGRAAAATSYKIAEAFWDVAIGAYDNNNEVTPVLLRLDEIDQLMTDTAEIDTDEEIEFAVSSSATPFFSASKEPFARAASPGGESVVVDFVDVVPEAFVRDVPGSSTQVPHIEDGFAGDGLVAEIVSDEVFDDAVGVSQGIMNAGEVDENKQPNELVLYSLRALDVAFFVVEKTYTVVIPKSMLIAQTASRRILEVQESGKGSKGWKPMRNAADAKGRY